MCVVLSVLYMVFVVVCGYVRGVSVCDCARGAECTCAKTFMCIVSSFVALKYVLLLRVVLCVWCVPPFVTLRVKCVFLFVMCCVTAFLDGYVRGVSVCDCALGVSCDVVRYGL
ncbi:putative G-Protein Coupled Receptor 101 [Manis pentadactyla]|nr:putative G-Protein Coupled Receptor 101 [Manis pentadactyla]